MLNLQTGYVPYIDVGEQDWFYKPVRAAYNLGLLDKTKSFSPHANFTRAEAAKMLSLLLKVGDFKNLNRE